MSRAVQVPRLLRRWGVDLVRKQFNSPEVLLHHGKDTVIDVGANAGEYGLHLRKWGYRGRIVTFEPMSAAYRILAERAARDPNWQAVNIGLGDHDGSATLNISQLSVYSSIRPGLPDLQAYDRRSDPIAQEQIAVQRRDTVIDEHFSERASLFLTVDTQGYEREVIRGAVDSLHRIRGVQVGISLAPLYEGEASFGELLQLMAGFGFSPVLLEPAAYDLDHKFVRQVGCTFFRRDARPPAAPGVVDAANGTVREAR
jgi:FkbM family methyltransferase